MPEFWKEPEYKDWVARMKASKKAEARKQETPPVNPTLQPTTLSPESVATDSMEQAVKKRLITKDDFKNRPQYAVDVINAQQKQFMGALQNYPTKQEAYQIPLLETGVAFGDRLYYDADQSTYTNRPTQYPLFFDGNNALTPTETDRPAVFDMDTAYDMSAYYENVMGVIETTVARETGGEKLFEEVTPESLQILSKAKLEPSTEETFSVMQEDQPERVSFRKYGLLDKLGALEEPVRRLFSAAYSGKFGKFFSGLSATIGVGLQAASRELKSASGLTTNMVQSTTLKQGADYYRSIGWDEQADSLEKMSADLSESITKSSEEEGITPYKAAKMINDLSNFIEAPNSRKDTPADYKESYALFTTSADKYNSAFNTPITDSKSYQEAAALVISAEKDLEKASGLYNANWTYGFVQNPEKEDEYYSLVAQTTLQMGRPLNPWERIQLRQRVADPLTELLAGLVLDASNLFDLPVGSVLNKVDHTSSTYKTLSTLGSVEDMTLGGLVTKGIWSKTGKPVFDTIGDALATHWAVRNMGYKNWLPLSTSAITSLVDDDVRNIATRGLGGAANIVEKPVDDMADIVRAGEAYSTLKSEGKSAQEIISALSIDDSLPAALRTKDRLETIGRMVNIQDPIRNGRKGGWTNLINSSHTEAVESMRGKKLAEMWSLVDKSDLTKMTGVDYIDNALRSLDDVPEGQKLQALYRQLDNEAKLFASSTIKADDFAKRLADRFSGSYQDAHTITHVRGMRIMDGGMTGAITKAFPKLKQPIGQLYYYYRQFMNGFINTILNKPSRLKYYNLGENLVMHAASGGGDAVTRTANLFANTPALIDNIMELPSEARRGYFSFLGVDDLKDVTDLQKFLKENPESWLPTRDTFKLFFSQSKKTQYDNWLGDLLEKKGLGDSLSKDMFLEKVAQDNKLFALVDAPEGKVATFMGKPVRFPTGTLSSYNKAWSDANRASMSMNELVIKAAIAQEQYLTDLKVVNPLALENVLSDTRNMLRNAGASDAVIDEAIRRINNNWEISGGSTSKFVARARKDVLTQKGMRADTVIPEQLRQIPMGMTSQEQDNLLMSVRDELNDYLTTLKLTDTTPDADSIHKFFVHTFNTKVSEINEALNPSGHIAYMILGDDTGVALPVSNDTQKLLNSIREGNAPKRYTTKIKDVLESNGVDTSKPLQDALDELTNKTTTEDWLRPRMPEQDMVVNAIEQSVPYESIKQTYGTDFTLDPLDQQLRLKMQDLQPVKTAGEKSAASDLIEAFHKEFPDAPINIGYEYYGNARGAFNGEVLYRLQELSGTDANAKIAYDALMEYDRNVESAYRLMRDRVLPFMFPGYKWITGKGSGAARKIAQEQANQIVEQMLIKSSNSLEEITAAAKAGQEMPIPTIGEVLGWAGITMEPAEDGATIARFFMLDPISGQNVPFERGTELYDELFSDASYFGVKNVAIWDAPITAKKFELRDLRLQNYTPNPIFNNVPEELQPALRKTFMDAYLSKPFSGDKNLKFYIEPFFQGEDVMTIAPDEIVKRIHKVSKGFDDNVADAMNALADHIEGVDKYFVQRFLLDNERVAIPFTPQTVPDAARAWGTYKVSKSSQSAGMRNLFDEWEKYIVDQASKGQLYPSGILSGTDLASINKAVDSATTKLAEMEDALWKGGTVSGVSLKGAIPTMKSRMRVADETVVDSFLKGIVPFWNFATRGGAAWMRIAIEHPNVLAWYQKYMRYSESSAIQAGLTSSNGQQLPSTRGKVKLTQIPGLQLWYNSLAFSPFYNYYFSQQSVNKYDDEDPNMTTPQKVLKTLVAKSTAFGARVSPVIDLLVNVAGIEDQYTTQSPIQKSATLLAQAGGIPTDLIPNWVWNGVDSLIHKIDKPDEPTDTWRPQEQWFDSLVEQAIMRDYLTKIKGSASDDEKVRLANKAYDLIHNRELDPDYNTYVEQVRRTDYFQTVAGWFTGVYAKPFYDGDLELYNLRDSNNSLKYAINNEIAAQIFYPDTTDVERYNTFMDTRYNTAEGELYTMRNTLSWVHDPVTGASLQGTPRREEINRLLDKSAATTAYYEEIEGHYANYENLIRGLATGAEYKDPRVSQWREELWTSIAATDNKPIYADAKRDWTVGFKPQKLVDDHFENLWYKYLRATYPKRGEFEEWQPYQDRVKAWEINLPALAAQLMPVFANEVLITYGQSTYYEDQDVLGIVEKLRKSTTSDFYYGMEMRNDTRVDAMLRAWEELYFNKWWNDMGGVTGAMRAELIPYWFRDNPKPTADQLVEWVQSNPTYSGKWTDAQLQAAMMTSDELDARQREILNAQQAEQLGRTEAEIQTDETLDKLWWVPSNRKSEFYKLMKVEGASLGIQESDLDMLYEFGDIMVQKNPEKFSALSTTINNVYTRMGITKPTGTELASMSSAQQLNNMFKALMSKHFGDGYEDIVYGYGAMSSSERYQFKKDYPDQYAIVPQYYKLKDKFAEMYPLWGEYYNQQLRTQNTVSANSAQNISQVSQELWGKLPEEVRQEIYDRGMSNKKLSNAAVNFLKDLATRYPQWAGELGKLIGGG